MKRLGGVYDAIGDWDNLRLAFWRAAKSARRSSVVRRFEANLVGNLRALREDLSNECVRAGGYTQFVIYDPKERIIAAPSFRDRVLHHAIMNVCEPHFDRWLVHDCYACRKGKGRLAALERATAHAARNRWFLKLDIRKYFDSIPHERLLTAVHRANRGGSWNNTASNCRAANRNRNLPDNRNINLGFRPAPAPPAPDRMIPSDGTGQQPSPV